MSPKVAFNSVIVGHRLARMEGGVSRASYAAFPVAFNRAWLRRAARPRTICGAGAGGADIRSESHWARFTRLFIVPGAQPQI
jgi:hypothetical protein